MSVAEAVRVFWVMNSLTGGLLRRDGHQRHRQQQRHQGAQESPAARLRQTTPMLRGGGDRRIGFRAMLITGTAVCRQVAKEGPGGPGPSLIKMRE